jgi:hypothetical protein
MTDISTRAILVRLAQGLKAKGAESGCSADGAVNWECEAYIEHGKFWVDSRIFPRNPEDSVWFTQTTIMPQKEGARTSGSAAQAGTPSTAQPGMSMFLHSQDTAVTFGDEVLVSVTGYIKIKDQPFNQYCFEKTIIAS